MSAVEGEKAASATVDQVDSFRLVVGIDGFRFEAEGRHELVMGAYAEVLTDLGTRLQDVRADTSDQTGDGGGGEATTTPLPVFLKTRDLDTNALKATAILVWAERYEGKRVLSPSEVEDHWRGTPYKLPGNLARDLGNAVVQGWVKQMGHGEYAPTGFGAEEIDRRRLE